MNRLKQLALRFLRQKEGATASEYAIMLMLILVAAIGAILNAGSIQKAIWFDSADSIESTATTSSQL